MTTGEAFGEGVKSFSYDFSYDSMNSTGVNFVTQEKVQYELHCNCACSHITVSVSGVVKMSGALFVFSSSGLIVF